MFPGFKHPQRGGRYFFPSKLSNHVSSLFSGWMKYEYVTMAITIFGFCLHAVMRQAFPSSDITIISSLSWPCTPSWTFWTCTTLLNVLLTNTEVPRAHYNGAANFLISSYSYFELRRRKEELFCLDWAGFRRPSLLVQTVKSKPERRQREMCQIWDKILNFFFFTSTWTYNATFRQMYLIMQLLMLIVHKF